MGVPPNRILMENPVKMDDNEGYPHVRTHPFYGDDHEDIFFINILDNLGIWYTDDKH